MVDLRSDTQTRPGDGMRAAMAGAEVGDEQEREDPTVDELERRVAALLGERGSELIVEETAHIMLYELAGAATHGGLQTRSLPGELGRLTVEQINRWARPTADLWSPRTSVLALENTHNSAGGAVWSLAELEEIVTAARELGLRVHLDGARLLNAVVASGASASSIGSLFDTVTLCLSKGLGCPLGALIAGSHELMVRARIEKHRFGGAMRQAGIVAAAGIYALDHNVDRLADDHERARRLAVGWHAAGLPVEPERTVTNFVQLDVAQLGLSQDEAIGLLEEVGVRVSATVHPGVVRAVTHLDVDDEGIDEAIERAPQVLGVGLRT